jgi:hypothetical protein
VLPVSATKAMGLFQLNGRENVLRVATSLAATGKLPGRNDRKNVRMNYLIEMI